MAKNERTSTCTCSCTCANKKVPKAVPKKVEKEPTVVYKCVNQHGNVLTRYKDGSYSYTNLDSSGKKTSSYFNNGRGQSFYKKKGSGKTIYKNEKKGYQKVICNKRNQNQEH